MKKSLKAPETKHKPSHTFGDLSTISTMISKTFQNKYKDTGGQFSSRKPKKSIVKKTMQGKSKPVSLYSVVVKSKTKAKPNFSHTRRLNMTNAKDLK